MNMSDLAIRSISEAFIALGSLESISLCFME